MNLFITYEEYAKSKANLTKYDKIWKEEFAARKVRGDCSYLYEKFKPTSYEDFYEKYVKDGEETYNNRQKTNSYHRGRSIEEILQESIRFYNRVMELFPDDTVSIKDCINNFIGRTIHDTYDGHFAENMSEKLLKKYGYTTTKPQGDADSLYGIDRYCYKDNELKFLIQVKPESFFANNRFNPKIRERKIAFSKEIKAEEVFKVPVYYLVYRRDKLNKSYIAFLMRDNKMAFKLSELCNSNGYVAEEPFKGCHFEEFKVS